MKHKKLKGFTLIELIVVMALFAMLLVMLSALIKPINRLFTNTKDADTASTAADGIGDYITNSLRFADNMYILTGFETLPKIKTGASEEAAIDSFCREAGLDTSNPADMDRIRVIYVVNELRSSGVYSPTATVSDEMLKTSSCWTKGQYVGRVFRSRGYNVCDLDTSFPHIALGHAYYGENDFLIEFENNLTADGSVKATDTSEIRLRVSKLGHDNTPMNSHDNFVENVTQSTVRLANSSFSSCFRVIHYGDPEAGSGATSGTRTWIIYTTPIE